MRRALSRSAEEDGTGHMKKLINLLGHDASNAARTAVGWIRARSWSDFEKEGEANNPLRKFTFNGASAHFFSPERIVNDYFTRETRSSISEYLFAIVSILCSRST